MKNFEKIIDQEVLDFAKDNTGNYNLIADKIRSYFGSSYSKGVDFYYFKSFIEGLIKKYIDQAIEEYKISKSKNLRMQIIEIADYMLDRRYDVMISLDEDEAFQKVLGYATDFLKGGDFLYFQKLYVNSQSLYALVKAYYNPKFKSDVVLFFKTAFDYAKNYARDNDKLGTSTSADPDGETLLELVQAISSFNDEDKEQFAGIVFEIYTYSSHKKRRYEMNQASGFMAIQLTYFQTTFDINVIIDAIEITGKHSADDTFVKQTWYAKWFFEENTKEAFLYFQKNSNPIFAVFALTDLGFKEALPLFIEKKKEEENPVMWEIYNEAIQRLQSGYIPKKKEDRMIWLNGNLTPAQRVLGAENDNVFVERAKQKIAIDDTVYETDED
ncbi:hypothetical protein [Flavobacterium salmonis]|uniref:Uncharacterized protein n=1 Tax=Flavobacterium salmonis TaxID=2654844 RepID=A0A6V6ZB37_9FLAO|nr:hypothetical protein [Flavobacterium salmonis]CAD0008855.1 hypothetical protein FLAT13_04596 [Flavobacterium salmonis]